MEKKIIMGKIVGRYIKKGKHKIYSTSFKTKQGALRKGKQIAKKKGKNYTVGTPFRWGRGWMVYTHKKKR